MRIFKGYYKKHIDRSIRLRLLIYLLIFIVMFSIVLYDSFVNDLPFHYILFMIPGSVFALIWIRTQKIKRKEGDNKFIVESNLTGIFIIVVVIALRKMVFPDILREMNVIFVSDGLLIIAMGWFLARIKLISEKIEEMVFSYLEKQ